MKTRLYQDVDGCINADYNARAWRRIDEPTVTNVGFNSGVAECEGHKYRIKWNTRLIESLRALDMDIVWTTTWRDDAVNSIAPLINWGHDGRVLHPSSGVTTYPSINWKYEAIQRDQERDPSPFIWCEDELADLPSAALEAMSYGFGGLLIAPDPNFGITPKHVVQMKEYIEAHR